MATEKEQQVESFIETFKKLIQAGIDRGYWRPATDSAKQALTEEPLNEMQEIMQRWGYRAGRQSPTQDDN